MRKKATSGFVYIWRGSKRGKFYFARALLALALAAIPASAQVGPLPGGGPLPFVTGVFCTGGTVTSAGGQRVHTFTTSGILVCQGSGSIAYLLAAGGGGGGSGVPSGSGGGGAGGAGGLLTGTLSASLSSSTSITVTIGPGGSGGLAANGSPGTNSSVGSPFSLTAARARSSPANLAKP